jgi:hypothetical protein
MSQLRELQLQFFVQRIITLNSNISTSLLLRLTTPILAGGHHLVYHRQVGAIFLVALSRNFAAAMVVKLSLQNDDSAECFVYNFWPT